MIVLTSGKIKTDFIKSSILYVIALLIAVGLKYHYSHARSDDLVWILSPTAGMVEYMSKIQFSYAETRSRQYH